MSEQVFGAAAAKTNQRSAAQGLIMCKWPVIFSQRSQASTAIPLGTGG